MRAKLGVLSLPSFSAEKSIGINYSMPDEFVKAQEIKKLNPQVVQF